MAKKTIIRDVHAEWHGETGLVQLYAEDLDGNETMMMEFMPLVEPLFGNPDIPEDASDYEDYYNAALEEAHRRGWYIEGEVS